MDCGLQRAPISSGPEWGSAAAEARSYVLLLTPPVSKQWQGDNASNRARSMLTSVIDPVYSKRFAELVAPLPPPVRELTARLVALVAAHPGITGKVMTGWRSVNFRHADAGHVCSVLPHEDRASLYFEHGRLLEHGQGLLAGDGLKKGRYLRLVPGDDIPVDRIGILLSEAIALFA